MLRAAPFRLWILAPLLHARLPQLSSKFGWSASPPALCLNQRLGRLRTLAPAAAQFPGSRAVSES